MASLAAPLNPAPGVGAVGVLLLPSSPSAVSRFVVAGSVDSVNGVVKAGPRAHVLKEVQEVQPAFANGDTTGTICLVGGVTGVQTTAFHGGPSRIGNCLAQAMLIAGCFLSGVLCQLGFGLFGVGAMKATSTLSELARVLHRMLLAGAIGETFKGRLVRFTERFARQGLANVLASVFDHVRVVSFTFASRLTVGANLGVSLAGASRFAFSHKHKVYHLGVTI